MGRRGKLTGWITGPWVYLQGRLACAGPPPGFLGPNGRSPRGRLQALRLSRFLRISFFPPFLPPFLPFSVQMLGKVGKVALFSLLLFFLLLSFCDRSRESKRRACYQEECPPPRVGLAGGESVPRRSRGGWPTGEAATPNGLKALSGLWLCVCLLSVYVCPAPFLLFCFAPFWLLF